jgi:basic membrane lipoprotein Med (substrate-binding protein (PBP1-ABC) superfamily)
MFSMKLLIASMVFGFIFGATAALFLGDLTWACSFGLISFIPACTNPLVFSFLIAFTAGICYIVIVILEAYLG